MTNPPGAMPPLPEIPSAESIRLACGEITPSEMRTVLAVLAGFNNTYVREAIQAYAAPLIARVAELEADRAKLREAVEDASDEYRRYIVEDTAPCNLSIYMMDAFDAAIAAKD